MSRLIILTVGRRSGKAFYMLLVYAANNEWQAMGTNGGHLRFTKPGRPIIRTPSDWRAARNALAMLVRADRSIAMEVIYA